jgi:hypothetical protein
MTLLEKIKINIDYLLGKADPSLYSEDNKNSNLTLKDWQARWEVFANDGSGYVWYGVDSEGNLAEFCAESSFIPEAHFQNVYNNKTLLDFFENLPEITTGKLPDKLRKEIQPSPERILGFAKESNRGIFIFDEIGDIYWTAESNVERYKYKKYPYELISVPNDCLKFEALPVDIQTLLEPFRFENLKFEDCQFLDISKYFYCEE